MKSPILPLLLGWFSCVIGFEVSLMWGNIALVISYGILAFFWR